MTTFEPRQTREWSTRELDALVGKQVRVWINGARHSGGVQDAGIGRFGCLFLKFSDGKMMWWDRDTDQATITVGPIGDQP
jgi:hypothetical protein